jgi:hypothetical protein
LADEYTKSLLKLNPLTGEYVSRLKVGRFGGGREGGRGGGGEDRRQGS